MAAKRILIVEDEGIIAKDIERVLLKFGYDVVGVVSTGEEALMRTAEARPDLVLMDIMLKGELDGIETAQHFRRRFGPPVVYLTAFEDPATLQRATASAPLGYVLKPFEEGELHAAIETALYRHQMEHDLRTCRQEITSLLAAAFDGIIVTDREGLVAVINSAASALTEWSGSDAAGKDWAEVFGTTEPLPSDLSSLAETPDSLANGARGASVSVLLSQSGRRIPVMHRSMPITDARGDVEGMVLAFRPLRRKLGYDLETTERSIRRRD
jgi:DNA-binding NarL/FixJ family response regulator